MKWLSLCIVATLTASLAFGQGPPPEKVPAMPRF